MPVAFGLGEGGGTESPGGSFVSIFRSFEVTSQDTTLRLLPCGVVTAHKGACNRKRVVGVTGGELQTGMKVLKHDGSLHHTVGILPTIPFERTVQGVREGRDELLDKALEVIDDLTRLVP